MKIKAHLSAPTVSLHVALYRTSTVAAEAAYIDVRQNKKY